MSYMIIFELTGVLRVRPKQTRVFTALARITDKRVFSKVVVSINYCKITTRLNTARRSFMANNRQKNYEYSILF